jgi:FKBP-type peptidyl-prolyl cis-trans isomerase FklB
MKRLLASTICVSVLFATTGFAQELPPPPGVGGSSEFRTTRDKASYGIGLNIGDSLKEEGFDVDLDLLIRGLRESIAGTKPSLSQEELVAALGAFQRETLAKQAERLKALSEINKREGQAFLAANKLKPGVKTTPSGLQYKIIKTGNGKTPKLTDTVTTHYRGTLVDGKEFDSSHKRGQPATFAVGGVIRGWTEALQQMKVGDKWELYIPAEIAYGPRGAGADIGPDAVLIFELELLSIDE